MERKLKMDDLPKVKKNKPKVRQLEEQFGGKWVYRGMGFWEDIEDSTRHVQRVSGCSCDYNCGSSPRYYMYFTEKGKRPIEVYLNGQKFRLCNSPPW